MRKEWAKALKKPTKKARQAALQDLFLPAKSMDKSIPNLSSIVVLVEIAGKKLLLTGDAHGDDIVKAWKNSDWERRLRSSMCSRCHITAAYETAAKRFSNPSSPIITSSRRMKYDNPDAPTLEALVKMHGDRKITLHFTNEDVTWSSRPTSWKRTKPRCKISQRC